MLLQIFMKQNIFQAAVYRYYEPCYARRGNLLAMENGNAKNYSGSLNNYRNAVGWAFLPTVTDKTLSGSLKLFTDKPTACLVGKDAHPTP